MPTTFCESYFSSYPLRQRFAWFFRINLSHLFSHNITNTSTQLQSFNTITKLKQASSIFVFECKFFLHRPLLRCCHHATSTVADGQRFCA